MRVLFFAFFLSIALTSLIPFRCARNPDGSTSMVSDPGIICYESKEHAVLVALAVAGILTQPAVILAWTSHATFSYPSRVASGSGLRQVHRHRFLFHRFKPESFYFGLVLFVPERNCRNSPRDFCCYCGAAGASDGDHPSRQPRTASEDLPLAHGASQCADPIRYSKPENSWKKRGISFHPGELLCNASRHPHSLDPREFFFRRP